MTSERFQSEIFELQFVSQKLLHHKFIPQILSVVVLMVGMSVFVLTIRRLG